MFRLEVLPAAHGDCLLLEYGERHNPRRILVDGGPTSSYKHLRSRLLRIPANQRRIDLLVVTHVDADHIAGAVKLLEDDACNVSIGEVWFNGYRHLLDDDSEAFGPLQGERLTSLIMHRRIPWNRSFRRSESDEIGGPVLAPNRGPVPEIRIEGDLKLSILGPSPEKLAIMEPVWLRECQAAGLDPILPEALPAKATEEDIESFGPPNLDALAAANFVEDTAPANGSSIALLVEHGDHRILLGGDAHPATVLAALKRAAPREKACTLDLFKLPHHGSKANVSRELLEAVSCPRYVFSTNGSYFRHPDQESVARVIRFGGPMPKLFFNYRSSFTTPWAAFDGRDCHVTYGADDVGLVFDLD